MASAADNGSAERAARFQTTHWSLVVAAKDRASPQARQALAELCQAYWYPLYAFVRRRGYSLDEAQDLTQEFFARLLQDDFLGLVDQQKGRFRSFLLACCKHFLANERDRARAQKRGGGQSIVSITSQDAQGRYDSEPAHEATPERLFERRWALVLLQHVLARLRDEYQRGGKSEHFERLKGFLTGEKPAERYAEVAEALRVSGGAVKVAVHRLRRRYRELLREEIGRTVGDPGLIDEEVRALFAALGT